MTRSKYNKQERELAQRVLLIVSLLWAYLLITTLLIH